MECSARRPQMAPNLPACQHALIRHMINDGRFTNCQIAKAAHCSIPAVKAIKRNLRDFGSTTAPPNGGGRPESINPLMRDALFEHLLRKPNLYLNEMVVYLWDEFGHHVTKSSINRTLQSTSWSKKNARRIANRQRSYGEEEAEDRRSISKEGTKVSHRLLLYVEDERSTGSTTDRGILLTSQKKENLHRAHPRAHPRTPL
jgi:transposase